MELLYLYIYCFSVCSNYIPGFLLFKETVGEIYEKVCRSEERERERFCKLYVIIYT